MNNNISHALVSRWKLLLLSSLFSLSTYANTTSPVFDPYEAHNRKVHDFNMAFDATFLKPPARLYHRLPAPVRTGISNMYSNILLLPSMANDVLQGQMLVSVQDFWRCAINSTLGLAGFFDVAAGPFFKLPPHNNDLGLTFAKWGDKHSPYIVIPFLGPSTIRDGVATLFDTMLFTPYPYIASLAASGIPATAVTGDTLLYGMSSVRYVDLRSQFLDQEPLMHHAFDKYAFIRDAYLQHRAYRINGGTPPPTNGASPLYVVEDTDSATPAAPGKDGKIPTAKAPNAPGALYVDE